MEVADRITVDIEWNYENYFVFLLGSRAYGTLRFITYRVTVFYTHELRRFDPPLQSDTMRLFSRSI